MELQSAGHAAATYQRSVKSILKALEATKAKPKIILNGLAYYDVDDVEAAMMFQRAEAAELQGQLEEIEASGILDEVA
jgi:hypothetical protein